MRAAAAAARIQGRSATANHGVLGGGWMAWRDGERGRAQLFSNWNLRIYRT